MSFSVGIHLWLGNGRGTEIQEFSRVLDCIPQPDKYLEYDGSETKSQRFNRIQVFEGCFSSVFDRAVDTSSTTDVIAVLGDYQRRDICYQIGSLFNYLAYDTERRTIIPSAGPLSLVFFGSEYCLGGSYYKSRGPVQLSFSDTDVFHVPHGVFDKTRAAQSSENGVEKYQPIVTRLKHNYDEVVLTLAKKMVREVDPEHLVICTESEVHPLTAHSIYHRDWRSFIDDVVKIARLHESGGVYFCDISPDDEAFSAPRKIGRDYGYLRGNFGDQTAREFAQSLDPLVRDLLNRDLAKIKPSRELLEKSFVDGESFIMERTKDSYFLTAHNAPFSYLSEPYLKLFQALLGHS